MQLRVNHSGWLPSRYFPLDFRLMRAVITPGAVVVPFRRVNFIRSFMVLLCGAITTGCASVEPVAAWERGYLAKDGMQWSAFPRENKFAGHVYTSKEASSGGSKAAGGGCGCN